MVRGMILLLFAIPSALAIIPSFREEGRSRGIQDNGKSFAVAMADIDADGDIDIYITDSDSSNHLYLNTDGKGHYSDITASAGLGNKGPSRAAVFADVDGDGNLDLYITASGGANTMYQGDGKGHFKDITVQAGVGDTGFGQGACFADVDGDGDLDLFVANFGQSNDMYINNGNGVFENATVAAGLANPGVKSFGCAFGDVDEDGDLDLVVHNSHSDNNLYINDGKGKFTDTAAAAGVKGHGEDGRAVKFADLNGDGHLDLFFVAPLSKNMLFFGDGTGKFRDGTDEAGVGQDEPAQGFNIADVDADGDLDIYVSSILESGTLYQNDGHGHFKDITDAAGVNYHLFGQGVAFGDIDNSGRLDMLVNTWGTPPAGWPQQSDKLLINLEKVYAETAWLKVRPVNEHGHATVLGQEVRLFHAGTRTPASVRAQIDGGSAFCSQNAYDAYFGLSTAVAAGIKTFDIEVRCGGDWVTKESNAEFGGVTPNQTIKVQCTKGKVQNIIV